MRQMEWSCATFFQSVSRTGVRQGQVLSPLLFAICIDYIVVKAKNAVTSPVFSVEFIFMPMTFC